MCRLLHSRVPAGPLRNDQDQEDHGGRQCGGGDGPAERESSVLKRLVEEIADGRSQRTRQDEGRPEEEDVGQLREIVERRQKSEAGPEEERSSAVTERGVRDPVSKRRSERLRKGDRDPIESSARGVRPL